ncbi:MAG: hypothetical protein ACJ731_00255 [Vicinamibacterales bacterium]
MNAMRDVAVATMTWARTTDEETLLRRSLALLTDTGLPIAIADAGTSATFTAFLKCLPGVSITVPNEQGLVAQVQASVALAATLERHFIFYVEPDKAFFFEHRLWDFLQLVPEQPAVGVVLASRSAESFRTFPPMQRYTEGVINYLCAQFLGLGGDYSYGPFLMNRALLAHVAALERRLGWGWRHAMFRAAHRDGLRLIHITGDYPCPLDQRGEDDAERMHRIRQLAQNISGLIA